MKRRSRTVEDQLRRFKRRFYICLSVLLAFLTLTGIYIYLNYDYLAFKHFISSTYVYTGTLDNVYKKELGIDVKGKYYSYFDDMVIAVVTNRIRQENNDRYTYLYTPESFIRFKQSEKAEASRNEIRILDDKTLYLKLANFSNYTQKFMEDNLARLQSRKNIIIDLMDDPGGDIDVMVRITSMFLPKKTVIATDKTRIMNIVYKSDRNKPLNYDKIVILQNKNTASASENMIAGLKDNLPNVTLVGEKTFGKGIGQYTLPLKRGFAVKATILLWYTPKNANIQGNGIDPDIPYTGSDILDFALRKM